MKLRTTPPAAILSTLSQSGVKADELVLSLDTDINLLGLYSAQWVVANAKTVWVFDESKPDVSSFTLTFAEAEEFRTIAVAGSGMLQAKVGGIWLDLVRYSNKLKYHFGRLAKRLEQLRQAEPFELGSEDDVDPRRCAVSGILLEYPGQTSPFAADSSEAVTRVMQLMRPYWASAATMMSLLILSVAINMIVPQLSRYLVDTVLKIDAPASAPEAEIAAPGSNENSKIGAQGEHDGMPAHTTAPAEAVPAKPKILQSLEHVPRVQLLLWVVGALAVVQSVLALINIINGRLASQVGTSISFDMRGRLVEHLEQLSLSYYDKQSVGSLVGRVAYDTEAVQGFMAQLTSGFLFQILLVLISGIAMFILSPYLALFALAPAPFVIAGTVLFYRWVYPNYERFWDRSSKQAGMLNGLLSGIRVVKAFAQEDREFNRFQKSSATLRDARRMVDTSAATYYPIFGLVFTAGGWIVWYVGGKEVLAGIHNGQHGISLGTLLAFFGYMGLFYAPLTALTNLTTWLTQFSTQMHRIFEVLDTPITIPNAKVPTPIPVMRGDIEFKNVTFGYSRQTPILKNVSFTLQAGQTIGVVGRSGSGKTTIINLISRFYDVDEGQIFIDGVEIRQIAKGDLRRQIGVVLQEPFLFRGTLLENLSYGKSDATIGQIITASRAGNAHDFMMRQMQAYDTWVGERGAGLSGGERQRLSIARALLCEPRILILDEATSAVDSESELAIQNALAELVKGRTSIIIAHRLSTLRNCDKIMVIDEGKLVEMGNHTELMKRDGKYAKLVKIQGAASPTDGIDSLAAQEDEKKMNEAVKTVKYEIDPVTGMTPIAGHRPRWLDPHFAKVHMGNRNALHVTIMNERIYNGVFALRCMPVRHPNKYISLRWFNAENREQEIGLIRDLSEWPADAQKLINESLLRRYLVHTILEVESIRMEHNYLFFTAKTDLGRREFIIRWSYESALDYGDKGKILIDVEENRYLVPDTSALPEPGKGRFLRYIYW